MTYNEEQEMCDLKKGDRVIVIRKAKAYENGWGDIWLDDMDITIGMVGKVVDVMRSIGIMVRFDDLDRDYYYPYFVLLQAE